MTWREDHQREDGTYDAATWGEVDEDGDLVNPAGSAFAAPAWPPAAARAFIVWCEEQRLVEDYDAPHAQAFLAGWLEGVNWNG